MTKYLFWSILCFTASLKAQSADAGRLEMDWPSAYGPARRTFFVHNEIEIKASPQQVWEQLIAAEVWPQWYKGATNVTLQKNSESVLKAHSIFTWNTMGLHFESAVQEFVPYSLLAWESKKNSIKGFHAWRIVPTATGCKVITEEAQRGWLTFFEKYFSRESLDGYTMCGFSRLNGSQKRTSITTNHATFFRDAQIQE